MLLKLNMMNSFQEEFSQDDRLALSKEIMHRYPDRIPIICEPADNSLVIDKRKFLAPRDYKVGHFLLTLRRRVSNINSTDALYIFSNNSIPPTGKNLGDLYDEMKNNDGLLYLKFSKESTFGNL